MISTRGWLYGARSVLYNTCMVFCTKVVVVALVTALLVRRQRRWRGSDITTSELLSDNDGDTEDLDCDEPDTSAQWVLVQPDEESEKEAKRDRKSVV